MDNTNNIIKYSDFILEDKSMEEMPKHFKSEFSDDKTAEKELDFYNRAINELNKNGGTVYRLVFLEDISDLDTDKLGVHWTLEIDQLSNFYNSLNDNKGDPYLITGYLKPNQINEEHSYAAFGQLPHELEVNLKSDPIKYEINPYKGTPKADTIWSNKLV